MLRNSSLFLVALLPLAAGAEPIPPPAKGPPPAKEAAPPAKETIPPPRRLGPRIDAAALERELNQLKAELDALDAERRDSLPGNADTAELATKLRKRIAELAAKLAAEPKTPTDVHPPKGSVEPPPLVPVRPPSPPPLPEVKPAGKPLEPLALALAYFRTGASDDALQAFRLIDLSALAPGEREVVQYLVACCLRKQGKLDDAAARFRELANHKSDPFVSECAQQQLSAIAWRRKIEKELEDIRQRAKAVEARP